jgi:hypothetical protein
MFHELIKSLMIPLAVAAANRKGGLIERLREVKECSWRYRNERAKNGAARLAG